MPPIFADHEQYFRALETLVAGRLEQLRTRMRKMGRRYLGRARLRKTVVSDRPLKPKERFGRNPTFSALTRSRWLAAVKKLRAFRAAYREAYKTWRDGRWDVAFPLGTWWMVERVGVLVAE
jgi:hypothetical protein